MHGLLQPTSAPALADLIGALLHRVAHAGRMLHPRQRSNHAVIAAQRSGGEGSSRGRVALVGAGPGDPELLTLKALRRLQDADVILHDQLVSGAVLALASPRAELIDVGKKGYGRSCKQRHINDLMVALAATGRRVVRLKAGDPLMFGRLEEEIAALDAAGISLEVVPGISAAQGAAARLNVPLTRRRGARRFQAITGHAIDGRLPDDFDWTGLADPGATTAVYMPKATIGALCSELLARGLAAEHPAVAVFNATRADEVVLTATVATLPERIAEASSDGPCIVLIGDAVARQEKIDITLFPLSLSTRGQGRVGEMTQLLSTAFDYTIAEAKKLKSSSGRARGGVILLVDEADALAQSREAAQMHHEDRAGVNALIRGINRIGDGRLPAAVIMCTNRLGALDPAVKRRAADILTFERPNEAQRNAVLARSLLNLGFSRPQIDLLVAATGSQKNRKYGFTFSDLIQRLLPAIILDAYPCRAIEPARALEIAQNMIPTPPFQEGNI